MGPILHVLTDPGPTAALRAALIRLGYDVQVATFRESRGFDLRPWLHLRRHVRDAHPSIIHAWGRSAFRAVATLGCVGLTPNCKFVACELEPLGWFDRRLARHARAAIGTIPPAVAEPCAADRGKVLDELGIPPDARVIACAGNIERGHGFIEAAWIFDILKYVYRDLWLLVLGEGSHLRRVEEFARSLGRDDHRVRFAGSRADAAALLGLAEVVWVLGECNGIYPALEALAAGRPVVARQRADLAELVGDAGILVPKADRHEVARATRRILDDSPLARQMQEAARARAAQYAPDQIARRWAELYEGLSGRM
jgi:glycosyltransferase involved in cell wall biosynthesis